MIERRPSKKRAELSKEGREEEKEVKRLGLNGGAGLRRASLKVRRS